MVDYFACIIDDIKCGTNEGTLVRHLKWLSWHVLSMFNRVLDRLNGWYLSCLMPKQVRNGKLEF